MDPSLPTAARPRDRRASAIVGGVGTHESALPTPDRVDLRGRCVAPGLYGLPRPLPDVVARPERHPARGRRRRSPRRSRGSSRHRPRGEWLRGHGWRDAEWSEHPSRRALDEVTGDRPAALWSKDYHSLWLNTAALARAGGDLEVHGGVVERDADGEPTGRPARGVGVAVPRAPRRGLRGRVGRGHPRRAAGRERARRRRDPRQGRLARRARDLRPDPRDAAG